MAWAARLQVPGRKYMAVPALSLRGRDAFLKEFQMDYGVLVHWKYQVAAFYILSGMLMVSSPDPAWRNACRRLADKAVTFIYTFAPAGLLAYSLYFVSGRV